MREITENLNHLHIFLCHSFVDKQAVRMLYERLREEGFDPWLDEEKLFPGDDWRQKILEAVRAADVVIVCLSRGSINKKGYVQKEIKYALDVSDEQPENTIYLIPIKLEECEIPVRLSRWHCVNLFEPKGYARLTSVLRHRAESINIKSNNGFGAASGASAHEGFSGPLEEIKENQQQSEEQKAGKASAEKSRHIAEPVRALESEIRSGEANKGLQPIGGIKKEDTRRQRIKKLILAGIVVVIIGIIIVIIVATRPPTRSVPDQSPPLDLTKATSYLNLGIECNNKKDYDCAIDYYNKAIEINPQYADAYYYRGISYDDKKDYNTAINDYTKSIELSPQYAEAYFNRGVAYDNIEDFDAAIKDYTTAIELKPRFIIAFTNRGGAYASKEEFDAAIKDYTTAIDLNPQYAEAFYNRGSVYDEKGEYNAAVKDYTQAIRLNPDFVSAYVNRGVAYDNIGDYKKAIKDYTKAIKLNPQEAMAFDNRSIDYQRIGENAKSQADRKKYEELSNKK